ncbi:MAG: hypothetical protein KDN20_10765 [Verrucomicrobiae bacterium]|nr:hypothetical protein [Verrucomicrobiae bacterium]
MLNARPVFGRTFTVAMWLLGFVAASQIVAVGWSVISRPITPSPAAAPRPMVAGTSELDTQPIPAPTTGTNSVLIPNASTPPRAEGSEALYPDNALPNAAAAATATNTPVADSAPQNSSLPPMPELGNADLAPPPRPSPQEEIGSPILTGPAVPPLMTDSSLLPAPRFRGPDAPVPLSTLLSEAALLATPTLSIPDPQTSQLVDSGSEKRASGDMQGALDDLRQAEAVLPEHPRILAEIAATYDEMGLDRKSSLYWEKVRDLGPAAAGAWHPIALGELTGRRDSPGRAPSILRLGRVTAAHDETIKEGERVVLSVTVQADPNARPSASEMSMLVYFYDLVDNEKTEASTADTSQNFISQPYDWLSNGEEAIEVIYHQPKFSEEQKRELGERSYYGYIIELYYRDELQDTAAFPPELRNLDPNAPPSPLSETPLFGPESSLFPTVPTDNE